MPWVDAFSENLPPVAQRNVKLEFAFRAMKAGLITSLVLKVLTKGKSLQASPGKNQLRFFADASYWSSTYVCSWKDCMPNDFLLSDQNKRDPTFTKKKRSSFLVNLRRDLVYANKRTSRFSRPAWVVKSAREVDSKSNTLVAEKFHTECHQNKN